MFTAALNPCTYGQLIYKKKLRIYNGEKTGSSISGAGKTRQLHVKEWNLNILSHDTLK